MEVVKEMIRDYVESKNTDYSVMITGDWGSGKTYFAKQDLLNDISEIDSFVKDNGKMIKYKPIFISLYGLSKIDDLYYKIQLELNPWIKSNKWLMFRKSFEKLLSVVNINLSKEDEKEFLSVFKIPKFIVLFFDDLERIDTSRISYSQVLGQINQFTEHNNLKAIIICNKNKTDAIFNEINEKVVRFSCEYNPDLAVVYDSMIRIYEHSYYEYLRNNKEEILKFFITTNYKNLRTLRFILDLLQKVYLKVKNIEFEDAILNRLLTFLTIYSIEYKEGRKREELDILKNISSYYIPQELLNSEIIEKKNKQTYEDKFLEKYNSFRDVFRYVEPIANYIENGFLDEYTFVKEIKEIQDEYRRNVNTPEEILFQKIRFWKRTKDDELIPLINKIIEKVKDGDFELYQYPVILADLLQIEHYKVDAFEVTPQIIDSFKKGIDIVKEHHSFDNSLISQIPHWSVEDTSEAKRKYQEIFEDVVEANKYALSKNFEDVSKKIIDFIRNNQTEQLSQTIESSEYCSVSLFDKLDATELFNLIKIANLDTLYSFNISLAERYLSHSIHPSHFKENDFFKDLKLHVDEYLSRNPIVKVRTVHFIELQKIIERINEKILKV